MTHDQLNDGILELLAQRDADKTICPSEVARAASGESTDAWRALMPAVRAAARTLSERGLVEVTQKGEVVALDSVTGPIRLRRGPAWGETEKR